MERISQRTHVEQVGDAVHIVVGPDRRCVFRFITIVYPTIFLCLLVIPIVGILLTSGPPSSVALIAVCLFGVVAIMMILAIVYDAAWKLFGTEEFTLEGGKLQLATIIFGHQRVRTYSADRISGLRYQEKRTSHRLLRKTLAFEYDGKEIRSTRQLTREEGQRLVAGPLHELSR